MYLDIWFVFNMVSYFFLEWNIVIVVLELMICVVIFVFSFVGNLFVCVVVYRNFRFWFIISIYIIVLVVCDFFCVIVEMFLMFCVLIMGKWVFGNVVC